MFKDLSWRFFLIEGIIQLVLGVLLLVSTDITIFLLVELIGIYWLIRGIIMIIRIFTNEEKSKGLAFFGGILGIIAGILVLRYPLFSSFVIMEFLVAFIAVVGIIQGCVSICKGVKDKSFGGIFLGIVLWIVCLLILFNPLSSVMALPIVVGIIWILSGLVLTMVSLYARKLVAAG